MFKPSGYRVLVQVPKVEEFSKGGIALVDQTRDREQVEGEIGTVVAVGPTWKTEALGDAPKPGDKVMFAKFSGKFIPGTKKEFLLINDEDVMAIEVE